MSRREPTSTPYAARMLTFKDPNSGNSPSYAKHTIASARGTGERRLEYSRHKSDPLKPSTVGSPGDAQESSSMLGHDDDDECSVDHHAYHHDETPNHNSSPQLRKCVCGICTCGRHRCPARVHLIPYDNDALSSSYRKSFTPHEIPKPAPSVHTTPVNFGGWDADQFSTVSRQAYLPFDSKTLHDIHKHRLDFLQGVQPASRTPNAQFSATSEYVQQFTPKSPDPHRRPSTAPSSRKHDPASPREFSPHTTNRDDFKLWQIPKHALSPRDRAQMYSPSHYDPTDLNSTYSSNYKAPPDGFKVQRKYGPASSPNPNDTDPAACLMSTTHRDEYSPKPLNICPSLFLQAKDASSDPDGHIFYELHDGKWV